MGRLVLAPWTKAATAITTAMPNRFFVEHIATSLKGWQLNEGLVDDATCYRKQANNIPRWWIINLNCTHHWWIKLPFLSCCCLLSLMTYLASTDSMVGALCGVNGICLHHWGAHWCSLHCVLIWACSDRHTMQNNQDCMSPVNIVVLQHLHYFELHTSPIVSLHENLKVVTLPTCSNLFLMAITWMQLWCIGISWVKMNYICYVFGLFCLVLF